MEINTLFDYLKLFEKDTRLNVWHFSLLSAVLYLGYRQRQSKIIKVSRSRIMSLSHVKTLPTYHKYFKELQTMGYIKYTPSYNPGYQSEIELLSIK
ncbi:hypothetical protein RB619_08060 [Flavobacterium sp. LHD-80]|uniref:hypothetical protein n=1 Tax=unclassified Flavobacterium TaxID=196869 RepID=UPI0027DEC60D|nr:MULTISPECIES: hypothetical protein [unclassified Flavobacterium]MDQ6470592.1 hypothetical protein [Flavobacterium sp. LHD-80]MDQ6532172.1 hypothetical protein [Flavobacterium sp. LHD-85]